MNNFYKDFCSTIDTKAYNNNQGCLGAGSCGLLAADIVAKSNCPELYIPRLCAFMLTEAAYTYFACKGGRNYTTDVKELREMHNLFIKNYNELNKV